jgi:prepilin-type N-terminal cleavage/methylation domain-containing protein
MMLAFRRNKGFTLIELLVVTAIMAVLMGLVGPLGVRFADKVRAQNEYLELRSRLKKDAARAFLSSSIIQYSFSGQKIVVTQPGIADAEHVFKFLSFNGAQQLAFNSSGFPSRAKIELEVGSRFEQIDLVELVL